MQTIEDVQYCPVRSEQAGEYDSHCSCWWNGEKCCSCGAGVDPYICITCGYYICSDCPPCNCIGV